jgi:hypothetical protein
VNVRRSSAAAVLWLVAVFVASFELAWWLFWRVLES